MSSYNDRLHYIYIMISFKFTSLLGIDFQLIRVFLYNVKIH